MSAIKGDLAIGLKDDCAKLPVIAREKHDFLKDAIIGDAITINQQAIQRWENEGGEIPNVNRISTGSGMGVAESSFAFLVGLYPIAFTEF